ncbi:nitronate monooxygenase [Acetobacter sp. AN02]|uniref:NAD(P)H-dependent flavin oxidoreductase n=1 Tax=Acetobacter sp. AN02 TaxID=2894186 RepID=UPI002434478E|nr:nitronate monooxygenase [Acetobacter sp. AN02]MDG6094624.1 nitronate monooxygenase [Acetobacter sp. AN02]
MTALTERLSLSLPVIQAPMAGVSTPELAAAVSESGALGSLGLGACNADDARMMIARTRERTARPFGVNLFVHKTPQEDPARETAWLRTLAPLFGQFNAQPPQTLRTIYRSLADDPDMIAMLIREKPAVISFHFGLPPADVLTALRQTGALLLASVTNPAEARAAQAAGIDMLIAQGIEAGGHRGIFNPEEPDDTLSTATLTRILTRQTSCPVIAAGGIMDGAGIAAALSLGAAGAQLGTAFLLCPESAADAGYRKALTSPAAAHTRLTSAISGRPARALSGPFTAMEPLPGTLPDYPRAYDAGKALNAAAKALGVAEFGAYWAGQGAPLIRAMPAAELIRTLDMELQQSLSASRAQTPDPEHRES